MASIGLPIIGETLYPNVIDVAPDDFGNPLQLLAQRLAFTDPISGEDRAFVSSRVLG
jgi:tRNA pseudouridine32 synthase/23S rRNA pseudouridine746 synthase